LSLAFFGFSQVFKENRSQYIQLAIYAPIGSALLTWWVFRCFRKMANQAAKEASRGRYLSLEMSEYLIAQSPVHPAADDAPSNPPFALEDD
jgi:hypothetical protein